MKLNKIKKKGNYTRIRDEASHSSRDHTAAETKCHSLFPLEFKTLVL